MRLVKFLSIASLSLGSVTGFAQTSAVELHKYVLCTFVDSGAKAANGNKVHIRCVDPKASAEPTPSRSSDAQAVAGQPTESSVEPSDVGASRSSNAQAAGTPTELTVELSDDNGSDSSSSAAQSADSSELPTGSDAHPADGEASQPSTDYSDIMDLELNN